MKPVGVGEHLVKCRKCPDCNRERKNEWIFRIKQEAKKHKYAYFMTWTYNDKYLPKLVDIETGELVTREDDSLQGTLDFAEMQKFWKRVRKAGYSPRYYMVGEYGSEKHTQRPHYHAIVFGVPKNVLIACWSQYIRNDDDGNPIFESKGKVTADPVEHRSIRYVVKYMSKRIKNTPEGAEKPKCSMSKGIGANFLDDGWFDVNFNITLREEGGYKIRTPDYYVKRLSEEKQSYIQEHRKNLAEMRLENMKRMTLEEANEVIEDEKKRYETLVHKESKISQCKKL
jgi:hypothetical protein